MNSKIIKSFNFFIRTNKKARLSNRNQKKYDFLIDIIVKNKSITKYDYQLCSTNLAKQFGVTPTTALSWVRQLEVFNILECTNRKYLPSKRSRSYRLTEKGRELVNEFNGFNDKYAKTVAKKEIRRKKWEKFPIFTYQYSDSVMISSSYLGCPDSLIQDMKKKIPIELAFTPRENNVNQSKFLDFFYSYNYCVKHFNAENSTNYKKLKIADFIDAVHTAYGLDENTYLQGYGEGYDIDLESHSVELLKRYSKRLFKLLKYETREKTQKRIRYLLKTIKIVLKEQGSGKCFGNYNSFGTILTMTEDPRYGYAS